MFSENLHAMLVSEIGRKCNDWSAFLICRPVLSCYCPSFGSALIAIDRAKNMRKIFLQVILVAFIILLVRLPHVGALDTFHLSINFIMLSGVRVAGGL